MQCLPIVTSWTICICCGNVRFSAIGLAVLLLLVAAGLYVLRKLLRELRQDREKRE